MQAEEVRAALGHVSAEERDVWVRMGMAVKSAMGESGLEVWLEWSATSEKYQEKTARNVWRSFDELGGVGAGSLVFEAKRGGWVPQQDSEFVPTDRKLAAKERRDAEEVRARKGREAGEAAAKVLAFAKPEIGSAYLHRKGLPGQRCLLLEGKLVVPMRHFRSGVLVGYQQIERAGRKKFLPFGMVAGGAVHRIGLHHPRSLTWFCEGYVTGLTIYEALRSLYRREDCVIVCFSAGNLAKVGKAIGGGIVIADNDSSGAGEAAAQATGMPYWMPPVIDFDANDYMLQWGLPAVAEELRTEIEEKA